MATNKPAGDNARKGAVKKRSQLATKTMGRSIHGAKEEEQVQRRAQRAIIRLRADLPMRHFDQRCVLGWSGVMVYGSVIALASKLNSLASRGRRCAVFDGSFISGGACVFRKRSGMASCFSRRAVTTQRSLDTRYLYGLRQFSGCPFLARPSSPQAERNDFENFVRTYRARSIIPRSSAPELSNNIIQKGLAFIGDWSGTVVKSGQHERRGILPRRLVGRSGASVVRRNVALSRIGGFGCQSLQRSVRLNPTRHEPVAVVLELMNLV
jgi:hypothetical protein